MISIAGLIEGGASGPVGEKAGELVHDISVQGEQLVELINDLLDLEKFEAEKMQLMRTERNCKNLLEEAVSITLAKFPDRSIEINQVDDSGTINADADRISQALVNILSYILIGSSNKSTIRIEQERAEHEITWKIFDPSETLNEDQYQSVFQRSSKIQHAQNYQQKQLLSVLALPLAKRIIESHGGSLSIVPSKPGNIFVVSLQS